MTKALDHAFMFPSLKFRAWCLFRISCFEFRILMDVQLCSRLVKFYSIGFNFQRLRQRSQAVVERYAIRVEDVAAVVQLVLAHAIDGPLVVRALEQQRFARKRIGLGG